MGPDIKMQVIDMSAVIVGRQDDAENPAGTARDFVQEMSGRSFVVPMLKDADAWPVLDIECGDVDGLAEGVLAETPGHARANAAAIGAPMPNGADRPAEMALGGRLQHGLLEIRQRDGKRAGHRGFRLDRRNELPDHDAVRQSAGLGLVFVRDRLERDSARCKHIEAISRKRRRRYAEHEQESDPELWREAEHDGPNQDDATIIDGFRAGENVPTTSR